MDYFVSRRRQRLIEELIDLQRDEHLRSLYQPFPYNGQDCERCRLEAEVLECRQCYHRRKDYCSIMVTYRDPYSQRKKHPDEIMVTQHHRVVYKGCLRYGDQFTFKSKRPRNDSYIRLKFFINDLLEDEMTSCCEHGLINRNRRRHLFRIEQIIGSKPCYECKLDYETSSSESPSRPNGSSKYNDARSFYRSSSVLSEGTGLRCPWEVSLCSLDLPAERKSKKTLSTPAARRESKKKTPSEGFSAGTTELWESNVRQFNDEQQSDEDLTDASPIEQLSPTKRTYGPPQLSMVSVSDMADSPTTSIHEQTNEHLFNSAPIAGQNAALHLNLYPDDNAVRSDSLPVQTQHAESMPPQIEHHLRLQPLLSSLNQSNDIAIANDATQMLLARLGILRQQQIERPEVQSDMTVRERGNVEYFALVYLHSSSPDDIIVRRLRSLVNFLKVFNDIDDCVAFINSIAFEKIILILSNRFCNSILSRIEELQQVYTIYVLHETGDTIDFFSTQSKIQGFYTDIDDVLAEISTNIEKISRDLLTYCNASSNAVTLDPVFTYFQLLMEIILDKNETIVAVKELVDFARWEYEGNEDELKIIEQFESTYDKSQAIYWFSRTCFISKMINKALYIPVADILYKLRVFLQDLREQMQHESTRQPLTVYLAQTIPRVDLDNLQKNISTHDLIVLPQFQFGSTDRTRAMRVAHAIPRLGPDFVPLLMCVDVPEGFACANLQSRRHNAPEDDDVLLDMNLMGRLTKIEKEHTNEDRIAYVHLKLLRCEDQQHLQLLLAAKRAETKGFSPFASLIRLMIAMHQRTPAEQLTVSMFNNSILRENTNIQSSIAACLHILAATYRNEDDFQHAVNLYLLSLEAFLRVIPPSAPELSALYINIATMYFRSDSYEKAHEYYQKGLDIHLHSNTPDLYSISNCTNSIGIVYLRQGLYPEAIKSFQRTLKILHQMPEPHESEIALTYDNIGDAYLAYGKYEDALNSYTKSLEIQERIEPRNPQTLGPSYHTIGNIYLKLGRCKEALSNLKRALEYQQQYLPLIHPAFALLYNNIGLMYYRVEQYTEAMQCYHKSLEIASLALPENHSMVGITLFNMALVYSSEDKYEEALESIEKSTVQFLKTLPPDHPDIAENQSYIESIRRKKMLRDLFNENVASF